MPTGPTLAFIRFCVFRFFRRVEVTGLEHVPTQGGGVLVSWHPNGLLDPALILAVFPRPIVFGARHGLFRVPLLGWLMRGLGTVPIYRAQDQPPRAGALTADEVEARRRANDRSLDRLAEVVAGGAFSCLFPEGDSHDEPHLLRLKTGAARFFFRAHELAAQGEAGPPSPPVLVPVGLHYDGKRSFRSSVLVSFHPPVELPGHLLGVDDPDQRARGLTHLLEGVLKEVVRATEDWQIHHLMHRARKLLRAERSARAGSKLGRPDMVERTLGFARVWSGYAQRLATHPDEVQGLLDRVRLYDRDLRDLGLEDHELDEPPALLRPGAALGLGLRLALLGAFLPPVLLCGGLLNLPALGLIGLAARVGARRQKDVATIKLLLGVLLLPLGWAAAGLAGCRWAELLPAPFAARPLLAGFGGGLVGLAGGVALVGWRHAVGETARGLRVRLTVARWRAAHRRLRQERAELHDALLSLATGLELPGRVSDDGRVEPQG